MSATNACPLPSRSSSIKQRYRRRPRLQSLAGAAGALAIHLCIGMAYGFSVFWLPMSKLIPGAAVCSQRLHEPS